MTRQLSFGVSDDFVDRVLRVIHGEGLMRDHYQLARGGHRYEIGLGCPELLDRSVNVDRAAARLELWIEERALTGLPASASSARASIEAVARIGLTSSGPDLAWSVDVASTPISAISIAADDSATADRLRDVCRELLSSTLSATFVSRRPSLGSANFAHTRVAREASARCTLFVLGEDTAWRAPSPDAHPVRGEDWAISVDAETIRDLVVEGARVTLGGWPDGPGAAPLLLDYSERCGIDTPFGCLDRYESRTYLDAIQLALDRGTVRLVGSLRQVNSAFYIPDWAARFVVHLGWHIRGDRPELRVTSTDVQGADGEFDQFARDLIRSRVEQMVEALVQGWMSEVTAAPLLDGDFISRLLDRRSAPRARVTASWSRATITPRGFCFGGRYNLVETNHRPVPRLTVSNVEAAPGRKLLSAVLTRTPASRLSRITWNWGDGASETSGGGALRVARAHDYGAGRHTATIEVEDADGGVERTSLNIVARVLGVVHRPLPGAVEWSFCDRPGVHDLHFVVVSDGTPTAGAEVEVRGPGWSRRAISDGSGEARVTVDQHDGWLAPPVGGGVAIGRVEVFARATGHTSFGPRHLRVYDCQTATVDPRARFGRRFADLVEQGKDIEKRVPRTPMGDGPFDASLVALIVPLIQSVERGRLSAALAALVAVDDVSQLEKRLDAALDTLESSLRDELDAREPFTGPLPEPPQRHGRPGDQAHDSGWVFQRGDKP